MLSADAMWVKSSKTRRQATLYAVLAKALILVKRGCGSRFRNTNDHGNDHRNDLGHPTQSFQALQASIFWSMYAVPEPLRFVWGSADGGNSSYFSHKTIPYLHFEYVDLDALGSNLRRFFFQTFFEIVGGISEVWILGISATVFWGVCLGVLSWVQVCKARVNFLWFR